MPPSIMEAAIYYKILSMENKDYFMIASRFVFTDYMCEEDVNRFLDEGLALPKNDDFYDWDVDHLVTFINGIAEELEHASIVKEDTLNINFTEGDVQDLNRGFLDIMHTNSPEAQVFNWRMDTAKGNHVELNISVGEDI